MDMVDMADTEDLAAAIITIMDEYSIRVVFNFVK
jgi:hypothetical protein